MHYSSRNTTKEMNMQRYKAWWMSKKQIDAMRKTGALTKSIVVNSLKGYILVEPESAHKSGGDLLPPDVAKFELDPAWCIDPPRTIRKARELLGL